MKLCRFIRMSDGTIKCRVCKIPGRSLRQRSTCETHKPGLGDMVEAGLSMLGITESRVTKVLGRPCGCKGRKKDWNATGRRFGI